MKEIRWCAIGDSFTYLNDHLDETGYRVSKGYLTRILEKVPGLRLDNIGINGSTLLDWASQPIPEADLYTVLLGTNDWHHEVPAGSKADFRARTAGTILGSLGILLDHIREDAAATRESLLTAEEIDEIPAGNDGKPAGSIEGLNGQLSDVLLMLLRGQSPESLLRERHLMPSVVADSLNEAFFDEIGDNVVECDGGTLSLVEDYREDIKQLLEI